MKKINSLINISALIYLCLPIVLFAFGWLKIYYSIALTVIIAIAMILSVRNFKDIEIISADSQSWQKLLLVLIIILCWVGLSGIGGLSYQNSDHINRNAVLRDLINYKWPVIYDFSGPHSISPLAGHTGALVYYLTYWLPAAFVGKLMGWHAANIALYIWTVFGVFLSYIYLINYLKKTSPIILCLFIFWSGLDILGGQLQGLDLPYLGKHIEWWARYFQYSSVTTTLYWVFNQTVPVWVIIMALFNQRNNKNVLFLYFLALPYAPFPFVGLFPFVVYWMFNNNIPSIHSAKWTQQLRLTMSSFRDNFKSLCTFQNIIIPLLFMLIFVTYFFSNPGNSLPQHGLVGTVTRNPTDLVTSYIAFCLFEFGLFAIIIMEEFKRDVLFWVVVVTLLLIPLYNAGIYNDFAMRASIPALIILMIYVAKYILVQTSIKQRVAMVFILIVGAVTPFNEIYRSIYRTTNFYSIRLADQGYTFGIAGKIKGADKFVSIDYKRQLFFKYLSK